MILSEKDPEALYPYFDRLLPYLTHENNILRYGMIVILSNLSVVDKKNWFSKIYDEYFGIIKQPLLIPAANVVKASKTIIKAKPELADKIIADILRIENYDYETPKCKNIILGHAILTFHQTMGLVNRKFVKSIIKFVWNSQNNSRPGTRNKALKFLKKYS